MLGVALAIKRESPGPIIFRRKRIGLNGSIFEIWKFRSIYAKHPDPDAARQTSKGDPRVTRAGLPKVRKYTNKYLVAVLYVYQYR
jgi:polysaccharide biosynthesis protein PslA